MKKWECLVCQPLGQYSQYNFVTLCLQSVDWSSHQMALNKLPLTEILGLPLFEHLTFLQETFWHGYISANGQGLYGTGKFWHKAISAHGYFSTDILAWLPLCQNVHVPKYPSAKMFQCRNGPVPKCPWCKKYTYWNVLAPKCPSAKMSLCQKVPVMKCPCWNVSCRKVPVAEISPSQVLNQTWWFLITLK